MKTTDEEIRRLAEAIAGLAEVIHDIVRDRLQGAIPPAPPAHAKQPVEPAPPYQVTPYDPVLTKRQLASHYQVSVRTIDHWCKRGLLPHYKIGKMVRFKLSHVQTELESKVKLNSRRLRW